MPTDRVVASAPSLTTLRARRGGRTRPAATGSPRRAASIAAALALAALLPAAVAAQAPAAPRVPTVDELVEIGSLASPALSPDGRWVAYTESFTDWDQDAFVTQVMAVDTRSGAVVQLTRGKTSVGDIEWSPDSRWITFLRDVDGKSQVHAIRPDGGEAMVLSAHTASIGNHEWIADGHTIVFAAPEGDDAREKARKEAYGDFAVVRRDYKYTQLWTLSVEEARRAPAKGRQRTRGTDRHVQAFDVSPDATRIAFAATRTPDLVDGASSDIHLLDLATDTVRPLVAQPGPDGGPRWSPDGMFVAFQSAMREPRFYHANGRVAVVPAGGGSPRSLTDAFDEDAQLVAWTPDGAVRRRPAEDGGTPVPRRSSLGRRHARLGAGRPHPAGGLVRADGRTLAFIASSATTLPEIHVTDVATFAPRVLTSRSSRLANWTLATREVISWKSRDGATIEGVLAKPADFDPSRKYPLLCVIHGGPTGVDRPEAIDGRYYPTRTLGRPAARSCSR